MKIAIIGVGRVGSVLGRRWAKNGHEVIFGARDPQSEKVKKLLSAAGNNASAATVNDAATGGEIVVLAIPYSVTEEVIAKAGNLKGEAVIDCINPLKPGLDELAVGQTTSAGEQVASWAKGARVVKAFNTTGSDNMENPVYDSGKISMFIAGDSAEAKQLVSKLAAEIGFEVVDTGGLSTSRYLEPLAMLWIHLAYTMEKGREFAFKIVER